MALTRLGLNQSINLATNVTGTLATGNGGTGATSFAPGKILQIQTGEYNTEVVSNSQSLTDTGLSATITLSSTSSKVLVLVNQRLDMYGGSNIDDLRFSWRIRRDISGGSNTYIRDSGVVYDQGLYTEAEANDNIYRGFMTQSVIDSPSSTAALTYKTFMVESHASASITANYTYGGAIPRSTIILMEF